MQATSDVLPQGVIRIMLADDHPLVLQGLRSFLENEPDIEVVATATDGQQLLDALHRYRPDVVVLDLQMAGMDGWACLKQIRSEGWPVRVLILSAFGDSESIRAAIEHQADGFVLKTDSPQQTVAAIRQVYHGHLVFPRSAHRWLAGSAGAGEAGRDLSRREWEVLELIARGLSNKQIARTLGLSLSTVKFHIQNIFTKIGATNRTEAARFFYEHRPRPRG
jgi:DNA-binding NarL/FixJ family response regulator